MFYVKTKINEGTEIRTEITDENVFTVCPQCGQEHAVDLSEIFSDGHSDLFGTAVYCRKCGDEHSKRKNA